MDSASDFDRFLESISDNLDRVFGHHNLDRFIYMHPLWELRLFIDMAILDFQLDDIDHSSMETLDRKTNDITIIRNETHKQNCIIHIENFCQIVLSIDVTTRF